MNPYSFTSPLRPDYRPHHEGKQQITREDWLEFALSRATYRLVLAIAGRLSRRAS